MKERKRLYHGRQLRWPAARVYPAGQDDNGRPGNWLAQGYRPSLVGNTSGRALGTPALIGVLPDEDSSLCET